MVHESVHVSTTIDCPAADVYDYASNPVNLSTWAAGLADQDVQLVDGQWVVDSPMGRVTVAFVPSNDFGILDHDVILPDGETVRNPMRVISNGGGCDVVFTVRRRPGMSETDLAADVDAVTADLAALRTLMEHRHRPRHLNFARRTRMRPTGAIPALPDGASRDSGHGYRAVRCPAR